MPDPIKVTYKKKGPIHVEGTLQVFDEDGNEIPQPPAKRPGVVKFCGCGKSATLPFCDGAHKKDAGPA